MISPPKDRLILRPRLSYHERLTGRDLGGKKAAISGRTEKENRQGWAWAAPKRAPSDASIADYEKVLQLDPSHLGGYFGRAQTYYEMRLLTRALADCEQVLQIEPCNRPARELVKFIRREIF